jgi:predicted metalloendopeptidase
VLPRLAQQGERRFPGGRPRRPGRHRSRRYRPVGRARRPEYLTVRTLERAATFLTKAFVDEQFAFYGKTLTGAEARARAKLAALKVGVVPGHVDRLHPPRFAQSWRTKFRELALRQRIVTDSHAPAEYRADTVRNLDAWYDAFSVKPGQAFYLAPNDRVRVW